MANAAGAPADLSGGVGIGIDGLLPLWGGYGLVGIALDMRVGGYVSYAPMRLGDVGVGAELGAWALVLPLPDRVLVMVELPAYLSAAFPLGERRTLSALAGYCLFVGSAESTQLTHCGALGARLGMESAFLEAGAFIPVASSGGSAMSLAVIPHIAFGWRP